MARRGRKPANKSNKTAKATVVAPEPTDNDTSEIETPGPRTVPEPLPSPPLDGGVVLAPTHKKFGKFRCLLGDAASSSPSSSSDDQNPVVEDWSGSGMVVAEEVILAQDEIEVTQEEVVLEPEEMSIEVPSEPTVIQSEDDNSKTTNNSDSIEKSDDIEPSFERLSILPSENTIQSETVSEPISDQDIDMESKIIMKEEDLEQQSDPTQDSQASMDGDSSNSNQTSVLEMKEIKSESTDTDNSNSSSAISATLSSQTQTRRRSSRIKNLQVLQESQASSRETLPSVVTPAASYASETSPTDEDTSTPTPPPPAPLLPPQAPPPSSKPVKVKSRWRRSSELEMNSAPATPTGGSPASCNSPTSLNSSPQHVSDSAEVKLDLLPADEERLRNFDLIKANMYLTGREQNKDTKRMVCDCFLTKEEVARGDFGCGEDCLNRLLMIECGSRCPLGEKCANKSFQRLEYSPLEVFRTEKKGFGLRAVADVSGGAFLTEYVGEVLDPKEFRRRAKDYAKDKNRHYYFMALKSDAIIDATMKGNYSRFINHSCDPNAETQKWTVNGELRIGFFSTKSIAAGEEITFDYQFQRYGKEAQRCYCESSNCRGWIGEDPEKEEKPRTQVRKGSEKKDKRKDKSKQHTGKDVKELLEDMDLEQEVEKLCASGLKNRAHTLTLCRLMVRAEDMETRSRLLQLLRTAEPACRRLFLDYHGLKLMWSLMTDTKILRSEIIDTLSQLPIPNKTVLQDSKVLPVIEKWAQDIAVSTSPDESSTSSTTADSIKTESSESKEKKENDDAMEVVEGEKPCTEPEQTVEEEESTESLKIAERRAEDAESARKLLDSWSGLKEVFRIPKRERIEQMKEHEREADRGYKEYLQSSSQPRADRYRGGLGSGISVLSGSNAIAIGGNKRMRDTRESPDLAARKAQRMEDRSMAGLTKYERRQLFALKVEEAERMRREQLWQEQQLQIQQQQQQQQQQQMAMGQPHPGTPYILDQNGMPCYWDPNMGTWNQVGHFPQGHMLDQNGQMPPNHQVNQMAPHPDMGYNPGQYDPITGEYSQHPMYDASQQQMQWQQPMQAPPVIHTIHVPIPIPPLPPKWKAAYDSKGQPYYYHVKTKQVQWEPPMPPPPQPPPPQETPTSSESSEESEEEEEDEEEEEEEDDSLSSDEEAQQEKVEEEPEEEEDSEDEDEITKTEQPPEPPELSEPNIGDPEEEEEGMEDDNAASEDTPVEAPPARKEVKRREGLVTEIIISPRREEDEPVVSSSKKYREIKEKLRRQKEKEIARKRAGGTRGSRERRRDKSKAADGDDANIIDPDSEAGRRIKEQFRQKMANVMVACLNPHRKPDCTQGRINSTEDFKHLARKLTHFVMLKELKHCRNVADLVCNDNVKHKARDFVKKYMAKFGTVYQREAEN